MGSLSSLSLPILEAPSSSPCSGCHAGCCRAYAVPLTGRDIFRIVTQKQVPFWRFVCRWADPSGRISRDIAPHFFFADDRQTPYVIALLQTESRVFPGTRRCVFLNESGPAGNAGGTTGRCAIYDNRPVACRVFPARLDEVGALAVHAVPEPTGESAHPAYKLCSRPWSVEDLNRDEALKSLKECGREMELFHAVARRWNDDPGPWPLFPDYLEMIYAALAA